MPSTTMLYRRLTGTTDGSGFYRNTHQNPAPHPPTAPAGRATAIREISDYIFYPHGGASEAPLDCSIAKSDAKHPPAPWAHPG